MRSKAALLFVVVALLGACNSSPRSESVASAPVEPNISGVGSTTTSLDATGSTVASSTSAGPTTSTIEGVPASCVAERNGALDAKVGTSKAITMSLTDVQVRQLSACSDVVKFLFFSPQAQPPAYKVSVQSGPFSHAGSGAAVEVPGTKFVVVRFEPAATYDFDAGTPTYGGSEAISPTAATTVRRVQLLDDSEGVVEWVIGLNDLGSFEVITTSSPPSLQVTIHR